MSTGRSSPILWYGLFKVDPGHPEVARLVRESPATKYREARTPGEAGCRLYGEAAERAGATVQWTDDSPAIRLGAVEVSCVTSRNIVRLWDASSAVPGDNDFEVVVDDPSAN
jgi:hypothetical protein